MSNGNRDDDDLRWETQGVKALALNVLEVFSGYVSISDMKAMIHQLTNTHGVVSTVTM